MTSKNFLIQLTILAALVVVCLFFMNRLPQVQPHAMLSWLSLVFFIALSALMYFSGKKSASSANKNAFTNTVLGFTMVKMLLCAAIVLVYYNLFQPESRWFLLPFFSTYLVFTAFETYWMMKLARSGA